NSQVAADLSRQNIFDFFVTRQCRGTMRSAIDVNRVLSAFAKEFAAVLFKVTNERLSFHAAERETASGITGWPAISSSDSMRFASSTSSIASARFDLASSSVSPCAFAPGNSSTKAIKPPSGTRWKTLVSLRFMRLPYVSCDNVVHSRQHNA